MADYEESYFLKYLFLIFVGFFASRHFSFNPRSARPTDKQLMDKHAVDKHAVDKHRPGSETRNGRLAHAKCTPQVTDDQTQRQPAPTPLR